MHTLRNKLYKLHLSQGSARSIDLACAKDFILNKMAGKEERACSFCLETTKYTCLKYLSQRSARSIDLACAKDFILNKMAGKEERACSFCLETTKYTCLKYLSQRSARSIDLACAEDFILNKMAGKEERACSFCLETTKYTCLRCERFYKKNIFLMCTRTSTDGNFPIPAISKAKRQDFSEQNLQKQHLKKTLLYSNRDYATTVNSITL